MNLILRFLSSLRLGLVLITLLALSCIAGSLIAANENMGVDHGRAYVFHTPWFLGLMGLLLVNLCLCSWEKSYIALTLYKKKNPISSPRFYEKAKHGFIVPWRGSADALQKVLKKSYTTVFRRGTSFYSQKGLIGRTGATIIHIGLLWTMSAGFYRILADDFGWGVFDSTVILPEGESTNSYYSRIDRLKKPEANNLREKQMPFTLKALDFTADFHPHSTVARKFSSLVEIRDGNHTQISEVTMQNPILYNGYKITQNSFSPNEMIQRGKFRITDLKSGRSAEVDAGAGDPVKVPLPGAEHLFFQADNYGPDAKFHMMNLADGKLLESGTVIGDAPAAADAPMPIDLGPMQADLADSKYAFLVAALFPNFTFDEQRRPTTRDEKFENPAVLVMLFKNAKPNGYAWLFQKPEAQEIVGQPHAEMEMQFVQYRVKEGADGSQGLFDYELEVKFREKTSGKELGSFWTAPGKVTEVPGVGQGVLEAPNVAEEPQHNHGHALQGADPNDHSAHDHAADGHSAHEHSTHGPEDHTTRPAAATPESGGAAQTSAAGGVPGEASAAAGTATPAATPHYQVTWLGMTTGNVTYLGYMKDPSVGWLFAGCIIIVLGTLVAFMITYRESWVWYDEEAGLLYMATNVRGTSPSAHREFDRIVGKLLACGEEQKDEELAAAGAASER